MISINKIFILLFLLFSSTYLHAGYVMTELEATDLDVPDVSNTVTWDNTDTNYPDDDDKETVAIGFPFQFDDTTYNDATILTNGIIKFGDIERMHRDYINEGLDTNEGDRIIAIYWDDLVDDDLSSVTYGNSGSSPNRKFIVNWTNVRAYSNDLRYDFQVVLYENGDIRYRYNNNTSNGESATIGLEIDDSDFIEYSYNTISVEVSFDLLFRNELLSLPSSFLEYRFDETSWNGDPNEVIDSSLNNLDGESFLGAYVSDESPALGTSIGTCNYGAFDGVDDYLQVADNDLLDFSNNFAIGVWVKISSFPSSGLKTIVSKDTNYEFHVNSSGQINWWWRTATTGGVREFNSTTTIDEGVWSHVVISFENNNQTIFINGSEAGAATFPENTVTNSNPLQFASDQNLSGRYFEGSLDEIHFFDQSLSALQAQELMENTRPCSSFNLCISSFPDGLNSHTGGNIDFGQDAQLFYSPDDILNAGSVSLDGASSQRSCVSVECQANGLAVDPTVPEAFPDTTATTVDATVSNNSTGSIGSGENGYRDVTLGNNATLSVLAGYSDYYIDDLSIGSNGTLNLVAGTYWINNFSSGRGLNISITGGTARVYINNAFSLPRSAIVNSEGDATQGDASQFLLFGYDTINTGSSVTFSGAMYAVGDIELDDSSTYYGAITGADISVGSDTNVYFNSTAIAGLDYGDLCEAASCTLGSFNITQPAYALACPGTRSQVSIQAICEDGTTVKDDYSGTVDLSTTENSLSEFYSSAVSTSSIDSITYDGSELGSQDVYLFHQNENPALQVVAVDSSIPISSTSNNETDFRTSGFTVTEPSSFICGGTTTMTLTAIGEDDSGASCQVLTGFDGIKSVKAWYSVNIDGVAGADTVSTNLSISNQLISDQIEPTASNVGLTFTSGVAEVSLAYANAGQILAVNIKHDEAPYDDSVSEFSGITLNASSASFVAKPEKIDLTVNTINSDCTTADASCSKFVAASSEFSVTAEAQCLGGDLAEDYQGTISLGHSLVAPSSGNTGSLSVSSAVVTAADDGAVQITNQSISEVGVFDLTAEDSNYFTESIPLSTLENVGRFYPDYFQLSLASSTNSCSSFSYMAQPGVVLSYQMQAHKTGGGQVLNYTGSFAKATMSLVAENDNDGGDYGARLINSVATGSWTNGQYDFDFSGNFARATVVDGPFQTLQVGTVLADNDGATSHLIGVDMKATTDTDCTVADDCDAQLIGELDVRFGQLKLSNVFGPEVSDLDMNVQTEYFDGADFVLNTDDSCTVLFDTDPPLTADSTSYTDNLVDGDTTPALDSNIISGLGVIQFSSAGLGNEGSVIYSYDTNTYLPWLNTENDNDGDYADNPFGKVTFGQFRGTDRVIYWREIVR